jgi:hypothetical protein
LREEETSKNLRLRLKKLGLSDRVVDAAWPKWWSEEADASPSARIELRFSIARKLGLDPRSLLDDAQPRFVWKDEARFKHLSSVGELDLAAITSFGKAVATILIGASPPAVRINDASAKRLREILLSEPRPFVRLHDLLSVCWSVGIPVIHLRVFPWPQKRMAAMAVRVGDRFAILLGKDSQYPPHVAFYLAHEMGHVFLSHLEEDVVIVDLEQGDLDERGNDDEENSADSFALELLTGNPKPVVLPFDPRYSARELARVAVGSSVKLRVEPGTLALCFGYSTSDWATANASMRRIYDVGKPVWLEVNNLARSQLAFDQISDDAVEFLDVLLGASSK